MCGATAKIAKLVPGWPCKAAASSRSSGLQMYLLLQPCDKGLRTGATVAACHLRPARDLAVHAPFLKRSVNEVQSPHASSPSVAEAENQHAATGLEMLGHCDDHHQDFSPLCCQLQRWRQQWMSKTVRNRSMRLSKI